MVIVIILIVIIITYVTVGFCSLQEISVDERCMATVGRVSNVNHHLIPIGSAPMLIKLGNR